MARTARIRRVRTDEWPRDWHWYSRFGIEPPFPWVGVAIWATPVLAAAATLGAVMALLIFGGDSLVEHLADF